ncbi:MAG TPA: hypothetical protein PK089_09510 [Methanoregulaceae archaeon]|nr:hypothetical protein [Methanoregulaceae archaeon]HOV66981.1 hypothetical protein [Methanoregulaceae archaeon]HQJ88209.1 hypothetical protein [Methanoregulaceae archaeon]
MDAAERRDRLLAVSIPVLAFGGIPVAIALARSGWIDDPGRFAWGCVCASLLLAYLAYLKPKKDIVSLLVPFFALLIFIVPMEITPTVLTQVLFAATLTALVVRLQLRFSEKRGDAGTAVPESD